MVRAGAEGGAGGGGRRYPGLTPLAPQPGLCYPCRVMNINPTAILDYYDGVQIFAGQDAAGSPYVGVFVDVVNKMDRYLVTAARPERLQQFRGGQLDLRTLLLEAPGGEWYLTDDDGDDGPFILEPQSGPLTDHDEFLPLPELFLDGYPYETLTEWFEPVAKPEAAAVAPA